MRKQNHLNDNQKAICVDENGRPMSWDGTQLCYCTDSEWQDEQFPIRIYTKKSIATLISKSNKYRKENNLSESNYKMMPIEY